MKETITKSAEIENSEQLTSLSANACSATMTFDKATVDSFKDVLNNIYQFCSPSKIDEKHRFMLIEIAILELELFGKRR